MPRITFIVAVLLVAVGGVGYLGSSMQAPTALIPAGFGILLGVCGAVARNPKARMHAMHVAVLLALFGLVGAVDALRRGAASPLPLAVVCKTLTAVLCLGYIIFAVRSFIQARQERLGKTP